MADFWKAKGFKALARAWNKKLEKSGLVDAEIELKEDRALKQRATNSYRQASELERDSRLEYYRILTNLVYRTNFINTLDGFVMLRHSEGATIKEINMEMQLKGFPRDRKTIRYIIRRWQMNWGIKNWSLRQRNLKKNTG